MKNKIIDKYLREGMRRRRGDDPYASYYAYVTIGKKEYRVEYGVLPGEPATRYSVATLPEIELGDVTVNGKKILISDKLEKILINKIEKGETD